MAGISEGKLSIPSSRLLCTLDHFQTGSYLKHVSKLYDSVTVKFKQPVSKPCLSLELIMELWRISAIKVHQ